MDEHRDDEAHLVSLHEAGHAVMAAMHRRSFTHVTVVPTEGYLGCMFLRGLGPRLRPDIAVTLRGRHLMEGEVMIALAGCAATSVERGATSWDGAHDDLQ